MVNNVIGLQIKKRLEDIEDIKEESGESVKRSKEAKESADISTHRSDITKKQLNKALQEGDQVVEVQTLRVDPLTGKVHDTASDRFEDNQRKVTLEIEDEAKLTEEIRVSITKFGASPFLEDNRKAIQDTIDYVELMGGGIVYIPAAVFKVKATSLTFELKPKVSIIGAGKDSSSIKVSDTTGDWGYLFIANGYLLEDVEIKDICLDCNVDNEVTETGRWQHTNRVLLNVGEAINFKMNSVKMITNGIWGFRGFVEYGEISDCEIHFHPPKYEKASFDLSTIWLGGQFNTVKDNTIIGHWRDDFIPETAIEAQGHYSHYDNNTVKGYKVGMIESCNTGYDNPLNPIDDLGALTNKITNNTFEILVGGITLWVMHVKEGSVIKACQIANNSIKVIEGNSIAHRYRYGIGTFKANLATGSTHDGIQTGTIHTPIINGNHIEFERRKVDDSLYFGDTGIRLDSEFEIEGATITGNTFFNIGGMGVYLNASTDEVLNPKHGLVKNTILQHNTFLEVRLPIRINARVRRTTITENSFIQQIEYEKLLDNMLVTIEAYPRSTQDTIGFFIKNNPVHSSIHNHRPFYPTHHVGLAISNYSPDYNGILEHNEKGKVIVQGQTDRYDIVQSGNFLLGKDGLRYGLTNTIQATMGKPYGMGGVDAKVLRVFDSTTLEFSDTLDIFPSQSLVLKTGPDSFKIVTVLSVYKNYVFFTVDIRNVRTNEVVNYYHDNVGLVTD